MFVSIYIYLYLYTYSSCQLYSSRESTLNTACLRAMFYMLTNQHTMSKSLKTYSQASNGHRGTKGQAKLKYCIYN